MISIRGHHLPVLKFYLHKGYIVIPNDLGYGPKIGEDVTKLFERIIETPAEQIFITNGTDSICSLCNKRRDSCSDPGARYNDNVFIGLYGLEKYKTYRAKKLTNIIKNNVKRDYISPLTSIIKW